MMTHHRSCAPVLLALLVMLVIPGGIAAASEDSPRPVRIVQQNRAANVAAGEWVAGDMLSTRVEYYDERGRLLRYLVRAADDTRRIELMNVYRDGEQRRAAVYFLEDGDRPSLEVFRPDPDGLSQDNFYAEWGETPEREIRVLRGEDGATQRQLYFAPDRDEPYAEESFTYDERGRETARTFRRLDDSQRIERRFEYRRVDERGSWLERLLIVDDAPSEIQTRTIHYADGVTTPGAAGHAPPVAVADLVGTWRVDLRPTPDAEAYYQPFEVTSVDGRTFEGTFYGTPIREGRINADWGDVRFAFVTDPGAGEYVTSGRLVNGRLEGMTLSRGRGFLSVWTAKRAGD